MANQLGLLKFNSKIGDQNFGKMENGSIAKQIDKNDTNILANTVGAKILRENNVEFGQSIFYSNEFNDLMRPCLKISKKKFLLDPINEVFLGSIKMEHFINSPFFSTSEHFS